MEHFGGVILRILCCRSVNQVQVSAAVPTLARLQQNLASPDTNAESLLAVLLGKFCSPHLGRYAPIHGIHALITRIGSSGHASNLGQPVLQCANPQQHPLPAHVVLVTVSQA